MSHSILPKPSTAHHRPEGGFRNPWALSQPHGIGDFLKWMLSRHRPTASRGVPLPAVPVDRPSDVDDSGLAITWIGHSTFLIRSRGVSVLTDPIWSDRASPIQLAGPRRHIPPALPFEALPHIDSIFISHDHYDHLDDRTVRHLISTFPDASWFAPLQVGEFLRKRGITNVTELDWWEDAQRGIVSACCTPAQHFSGRFPWNRNATLWCGWVIRLGDYSVFFAGDTGLHPEFSEIARRFGPFEAALLPIGAYEPRWFMQPVHMSPEDAVSAYLEIARAYPANSCIFIPSHWGTFRLTDEPLDEPPRLLRRAWTDAGLPENRLLLVRPGETLTLPQSRSA